MVTPTRESAVPAQSGLRRNARALLAGGALLAAILFVVPDVTPRSQDLEPVHLVHGRILEIVPTDTPAQPNARVEVLEGVAGGPATGDIVEGFVQGLTDTAPDYRVGDEVVVQVSTEPEVGFVAISDRYRVPTLGLLLGLFAASVTLVGGWQGVRSLIALALTLAVVIRIVVPLILAGWDAAWVAIAAATGVTAVSFALTEGVRRTTVAAAVGTAASLALVAILASVFDALARFGPLRGSESAGFLISMGGTTLDLGGIVLAAIIFGALRVLDDVTVTQAAAVQELADADPSAGRTTLARRSMRVGRSHIAATVNTLVLAYVGASLPLIILFVAGGQEAGLVVSGEIVAVEIVRALTGSIGIVAAVPITTAVAVGLVGRRLPLVGDGRAGWRAPGWDP